MPVSSRRVLLAGAMGTILGARGIHVDGPAFATAAVVEHPEVVRAVHASYAEAGATVHTAATFRATREALAAHVAVTGRALPDAREVARLAIAIARSAARPGDRVGGSLASVADCYRPDDVPDDTRASHREHARDLADAGADLILCETFASPTEAEVAVAEAVATGLPVWLALTAGPDATLLDPDRARAVAARAVSLGASAILINCTKASETARFVRALSGIEAEIGAYANAADDVGGAGREAEGEPTSKALEEMALKYSILADDWVGAGATILGGCCGTGPAHIGALARRFGLAPGK